MIECSSLATIITNSTTMTIPSRLPLKNAKTSGGKTLVTETNLLKKKLILQVTRNRSLTCTFSTKNGLKLFTLAISHLM